MPQYKKNVYVLSSIYGSSIDAFRNAVGNYWSASTFFPDYGDMDSNNISPLIRKKRKKVNSLKIIPRMKKTKDLGQFPFVETTHRFEIYAPKALYEDDTAWIRYIENIYDPTKVYLDFCFDVENPLASSELKSQNLSKKAVYEDFDFKYNYYARQYELSTGDSETKETILPNLYMFMKNREDETNDKFFQALTAGGALEKSKVKNIRTDKEGKNPEFFDIFGPAVRNQAKEKIEKIALKSKNIIFDTNSAEIMKRAPEYATLFPMQVRMDFSTDAATEFTEVLKDSELATSLVSYLSLIPKQLTEEAQRKFFIRKEPMERFYETVQTSEDMRSYSTTVGKSSVDVRIIDIERWINKISKNKKIVRTKGASIIGEKSKLDKASQFEKMMYMIIFSGKLKAMVDKYHRSYTQISDGQKSYSETICYKVEKFRTEGGSDPIQTIWFPNSNELEVITYIDTQVKYDRQYTYRATAYQFVIGSEYRYNNLKFPDIYDPPFEQSDILVQNGRQTVEDYTDTTARESDIQSEFPMPTLFLENEYSRYYEIMDDFNDLTEDIYETSTTTDQSNLFSDFDMRNLMNSFTKYTTIVGALRALNGARAYPSYLKSDKTYIQTAKEYLSTLTEKVNTFLSVYKNQYLPSIASDEKRLIMKSISDDLYSSTGWMSLQSAFYKEFETIYGDYRDEKKEYDRLVSSDSSGFSSHSNTKVDEQKQKLHNILTKLSALCLQFNKYYKNVQNMLYLYTTIDANNLGSMRPALQVIFRDANEADTTTIATSDMATMQSLNNGGIADILVDTNDSYDKRQYSDTFLEESVEDNTRIKSDIKSPKQYISIDKTIYKTKYANRLYVVAKKRESVDNSKFFKASLAVTVRPSIKIAEVPFFETSGVIHDNPPVPPEVTIIPYRGVKNRILLNLNSASGKYEMYPVMFNNRDKMMVEQIRDTKNLPKNGKITYSTDDSVTAFEIYRLESPPTKVEDFANNLRKYLPTDINSLTLQKASSASFVDNINPNTDYYYVFRSVDIHGAASNPTEIRKVRIVENDGAIYPLMEIYEIENILPQTPIKKCKKLINIVPRSTQTLIDFSKSDMGDGTSTKNVKKISLGQEDRNLFGRRFKLRLTSNKTGKQIDLNVNFNIDFEQI